MPPGSGRIGLRTRLAAALVLMAVLAVGTATVLSNFGLPARVNDAAAARLEREAAHLAAAAASFYEEDGGWTEEHVRAVEHLAAAFELRAEVVRAGDVPRARSEPPVVDAPVLVGGRRVGMLVVRPVAGRLLSPEEEHLRHSLDRLHLAAAGISVFAALALAFVLAQGLAGPLRRIRRSAERIASGDLEVRVTPAGGPELESLATSMNRLAETLAHEEELRKEGFADLAHELRTPVNGILGRIEAAQDGVLEPKANLAAMHMETLRLARLLDDLGRLAEAERPGLLVDKIAVDLAEVAARTAEQWEPRFAGRGVPLQVDVRPATVMGDADRLAQVVDNLLANALRYSEAEAPVALRVRRDGAEAVLEVADRGVGIAADELPHVFKRFWRGEKSRSRETGGAGIGLAIVAELVRAHEGRVDVESSPGHGSTFRVIIPAVR